MTSRTPRIIGYLASFRDDMALCTTELHRAQVCRLYRHERWMHNWTAQFDPATNTVYAQRRHRLSGEVEFAFPPDTHQEVRRSIQQRHTPEPCTPSK